MVAQKRYENPELMALALVTLPSQKAALDCALLAECILLLNDKSLRAENHILVLDPLIAIS